MLRPRLRAISLLVCDVDGVLTDGGLHYDEDGMAVRTSKRAGITVALLSGGRSGAIEQRARHLRIEHCRTGVGDKHAWLQQLQLELGIEPAYTSFLGEDLIDLALRPISGLLVGPADAVAALRRQADWDLQHPGGVGALREFSDALLASLGHLKALHRHGWRNRNACLRPLASALSSVCQLITSPLQLLRLIHRQAVVPDSDCQGGNSASTRLTCSSFSKSSSFEWRSSAKPAHATIINA